LVAPVPAIEPGVMAADMAKPVSKRGRDKGRNRLAGLPFRISASAASDVFGGVWVVSGRPLQQFSGLAKPI
jgi:hypothetical protein